MTIPFSAIEAGQSFVSARVTVTETHIVLFAGLTGDFNPLHMDAEFTAGSDFGRRIAHGMLGHALSTGLRSPIDDWAIEAFLETRRRFVAPVFAGDTVHYQATVLEARPSRSREGAGIVRIGMSLRNQQGVVVQEGEDVLLVGGGVEGELA
ncbi:MaoC family dehydratase N-terminal domain-containing protein [Ancylobacter sonchi]|uniref:MaoC/PaaZ C-terminal domain-containing protein n=1 Tax=Ancylobacter sonchi TaxID=1937790 RepID=UPI001BD5894F|nr:MaoC/PaaZ C-terminal domain-containing protein [Ancylobacter sonchi]MBS7534764.1 MaoC family dehydratase N-terminal domain-containing protein [Ancylobacter sonchi]